MIDGRVVMGKKKIYKEGFLAFISQEIEVIEQFIKDHPEMDKGDAVKEWIIQHAAQYREDYDTD
jgi:hypothetical protein